MEKRTQKYQRARRSEALREEIASLVGVYLDVGDTLGALGLARRIEESETGAGRHREFLTAIYEMSDKRQPTLGFLEYLAELLNRANREAEYSRTLLKLFQTYYMAGNFAQAGEALDRAAELDPYEPGHSKRLDLLRNRIDPNHFNRIARRFHWLRWCPELRASTSTRSIASSWPPARPSIRC